MDGAIAMGGADVIDLAGISIIGRALRAAYMLLPFLNQRTEINIRSRPGDDITI